MSKRKGKGRVLPAAGAMFDPQSQSNLGEFLSEAAVDPWRKKLNWSSGTSTNGYDYDKYGEKKTKGWEGERCYSTHPALVLPGTELRIYGGSCSSPVVTDADVYVGFAYGMLHTSRGWPWTPGYEVSMEVPDQSIPRSAPDFRRLVDWVKERLEAGDKVHCGCVGGHGRTGMFLAALVSLFGEADAITYVRQHYCKKAVESRSQVAFLAKQYGITPAEARYTSTTSSGSSRGGRTSKSDSLKLLTGAKTTGSGLPGGAPTVIQPLSRGTSIWGASR